MENKNWKSQVRQKAVYYSFKENNGALDVYSTMVHDRDGSIEKTDKLVSTIHKDVYESLTKWFETKKNQEKALKKEIDYKDRTYLDRRRILRQLSTKDEIRNFLDIVTDEVHTCFLSNFRNNAIKSVKERIGIEIDDLTLWYYIRTLLIDGYLAFEIIYDDRKKNILDLQPVDPVTLIIQVDSKTNNKYWIQHNDNEHLKRILSDDQIIYVAYSRMADLHISYVEELKEAYERLKMVESSVFFTLPGAIRGDLMSVKWLTDCLNTVSKIPKSQISIEGWVDNKNDNTVRYHNFIKRITNIFQTEIIDKINNIKSNL